MSSFFGAEMEVEPVPFRLIPVATGVRMKKDRHERPKGFPWRKNVLYNCLCT
jgi:hypothetical protein